MPRAKEAQFGLVFEPLLPDGAHACSRKGSATYSIVAHGISAHAGRDYAKGKNAIAALVKALSEIQQLQDKFPEILINVGTIRGGEAPNIVPDLAIAQINVRTPSLEQAEMVKHQIQQTVARWSIDFFEETATPPKPFNQATQKFFKAIKGCAELLGIPMTWHETGGVCDGNRLAQAGLPAIDSMGAEGGNIHTENEFLVPASLVRRARLAALVLMQIAEGRIAR